MARKRNYWLKLQKDFLKRHDIKYIKSLPEGHKIALFYLELLLEGIDHDGRLRFNEYVPYDEEMLATVLGYDLNIVKMSIATLTKLHLLEVLDDGTMYMTKLETMLGIGNGDDSNLRKKLSRDRQKTSEKLLLSQNVTPLSQNVTLDIDKEIELDIEKDKEIEKKEKQKKIRAEFFSGCDDELKELISNHEKVKRKKYTSYQFNELEKLSGGDKEVMKQIVEQSLAKGWTGLFEVKTNRAPNQPKPHQVMADFDAKETKAPLTEEELAKFMEDYGDVLEVAKSGDSI